MTETLIVSSTPAGIFLDRWRHCVGSGHLGLALHAAYQDCLDTVQCEIGFRYLRGHGILSDRAGVCHKVHHQTLHPHPERPFITNFTYVDRIYDALLARRIRPFVELSSMPECLASGATTCFWERANVTPPKDLALWARLVREFAAHLVDRYGLAEVRQWPFEVWNEPNLSTFWTGTMADYFALYRATAEAVKSVDSGLQVGGPALCPGGIASWLEPFFEFIQRETVPLDFVTVHSYWGAKHHCAAEFFYQDVHPVEHGLAQFRRARERVDGFQRARSREPGSLPLHVTEYNTSFSPVSPIHDTAYNAAFLGRVLCEGGDYADSFSYWTFCDVFEECGVPQSPFHGGFGLLNQDGIPKPTFHLFAFARRLGEAVLHRDQRCLVTRRQDGSLAVLAWNPCGNDDSAACTLRLALPLAGTGDALVSTQTVDDTHGNAFTAWRLLGRPRYPSRAQVEQLRDAARPVRETSVRSVSGGVVEVSLVLSPNAVVLCEVSPRHDNSADYPGLDDRRLP